MNLVAHCGVQQGPSGDLLVGLPTQMTEFHAPLRALYIIESPIPAVVSVLAKNKTIRDIVENDWVRFLVYEPVEKRLYRQCRGQYLPLEDHADSASGPAKAKSTAVLNIADDHVGEYFLQQHWPYARRVVSSERNWTVLSIMVCAAAVLWPVVFSATESSAPSGGGQEEYDSSCWCADCGDHCFTSKKTTNRLKLIDRHNQVFTCPHDHTTP